MQQTRPSRRAFLASAVAAGLTAPFGTAPAHAQWAPATRRAIPSTGEAIPVVGMGTWITFNVGGDEGLRTQRTEVLREFFAAGGGVVDSSPMYGSSEEVVGDCLRRLGEPEGLFAATKVWTPLQFHGARQIEASKELWGRKRFDLIQIHNLLSWEAHLETLVERKRRGEIRYIGITTSHGSRHGEMEEIMKSQAIDFIQLTYNAVDREAERRLLPLAAERGLGVIVNRPFRRGALVDAVQRHKLPDWAAEIECTSWPQFLLKFIVSHPAVTCAIPATSRVDHMRENMGAARGRLPDATMRSRMARHVQSL